MNFQDECARKDRLLDLFRLLEDTERERMKKAKQVKPFTKYERMFNDVVEVTKVGPENIHIQRSSGKVIRSLEITPEIAKLLRAGDRLGMIGGLNQGRWRLISMMVLASPAPGKDQYHISVMNPFSTPKVEH